MPTFKTVRSCAILTLLFGLGPATLLAQTPPKFPPCPTQTKTCNEDLGHDVNNDNTKDGCTKWCTGTPLKFTPDPVQACQNEPLVFNIRVDDAMDSKGNAIQNGGGIVDWGDGSPEQQIPMLNGNIPFNQNLTHPFPSAGTYYPSATVAQQFAYTGAGSCGYRCRSQQTIMAIVYLATSPECATGRFVATPNSKKIAAAESKKFKAMLTRTK